MPGQLAPLGGLAPLADVGDVQSVTTYTLTGPSSGTVGVATSNYTVTLGTGYAAGTIRVTPNDGGGGGSFAPAFLDLTDGTRSGTFGYTPSSAGVKTIGVTDDSGLGDPPSISFTAIPETNEEDPMALPAITNAELLALAAFKGGVSTRKKIDLVNILIVRSLLPEDKIRKTLNTLEFFDLVEETADTATTITAAGMTVNETNPSTLDVSDHELAVLELAKYAVSPVSSDEIAAPYSVRFTLTPEIPIGSALGSAVAYGLLTFRGGRYSITTQGLALIAD